MRLLPHNILHPLCRHQDSDCDDPHPEISDHACLRNLETFHYFLETPDCLEKTWEKRKKEKGGSGKQ